MNYNKILAGILSCALFSNVFAKDEVKQESNTVNNVLTVGVAAGFSAAVATYFAYYRGQNKAFDSMFDKKVSQTEKTVRNLTKEFSKLFEVKDGKLAKVENYDEKLAKLRKEKNADVVATTLTDAVLNGLVDKEEKDRTELMKNTTNTVVLEKATALYIEEVTTKMNETSKAKTEAYNKKHAPKVEEPKKDESKKDESQK
ncbi:MAG: hypothetical protein WC436_01795 [Candidatus Babeliales bacterium]